MKLMLLNQIMNWVVGGAMWRQAQAWVKLYEDSTLTGAEKRAKVVAGMLTEAQALGIVLAESLINFAVEAAVQYVRQRQQSST